MALSSLEQGIYFNASRFGTICKIHNIDEGSWRYLTRELEPWRAIPLQALPSFLNSWADKSSDQCIFSALQLMFWTHDLLVFCPWFIECPTNFYPAEEKTLRLLMEPSQQMKEGPQEEQQPTGRGSKRKRKTNATPTSPVPPKVIAPPPPPAPITQNDKGKVDLHLDDIALTLSPSQVVIVPTPSNSILQSQQVAVKVSDGSNIHKVSIFLKNASISDMLENGAIDNLVLVSAFEFVKKVGHARRTRVSSEICKFGGFDLIIADLPEDSFFTDDAPLLLFLPEFKTVRDDVRTYTASYGFALAKGWWTMNELPLCLPTDTKLTTRRFRIMMFFRLEPRPQFVFNKSGGLSTAEALDIFFNRTTSKTQLMHGDVPWRGAREKDPESLQFLIETLTKPEDVVLYAYASTYKKQFLVFFIVLKFKCSVYDKYVMMSMVVFVAGASIHVCRRSGRHLVAFEKDFAIFNAILHPLRDSSPSPIVGGSQSHNMAFEDDEEPVRKVPRKSRLKK